MNGEKQIFGRAFVDGAVKDDILITLRGSAIADVMQIAAQLLPGEDIPQPELRLETAVGLGDAAGDQCLGIDLPPVGKAR